MSFRRTFQNYREALLRLIYPAHCGACSLILELEESGLCRHCLSALRRIKLPLEAACLDHAFKHISQSWALYPYESPMKEILSGIKFYGRRWLLKSFREDFKQLAELIASENSYDWIVPVPLDAKRLLQRQFNQSALIAEIMSEFLGCSTVNALMKPRETPAQVGLTRAQREKNLLFAFESRRAEDKNILLVDDVLTTGATAEEAARVLKAAGAKHVDLVTLACNPRELSAPETFSPLYTAPNFVGY